MRLDNVAGASARTRAETARVLRFVAVGIVNTAIGYGMILAALLCGLGDYAANMVGFALGLPISYGLHRRLTFQAKRRANSREAAAYLLAFVIAYAANLGVIAVGHAAGIATGPLLQAAAICCYAGLLFVLTRFIVFRPH